MYVEILEVYLGKSHLTNGEQVVSDGIYETIKRQQEGWGYIQVAH